MQQRVERCLQLGQVRACFDLNDYLLFDLLDALVQTVEERADLVLHALLERIWLQLLNLVQVAHQFFILRVDSPFGALGGGDEELRALKPLFKDALVAAVDTRVLLIDCYGGLALMDEAHFVLLELAKLAAHVQTEIFARGWRWISRLGVALE